MHERRQLPDLGGRSPSLQRAMRVLERLVALAVTLLLLESAFAHLGNPYYFLSAVLSYDLTGIALGQWISITLPYVQIVVAVCLLARWWLEEAYLLGSLMLSVLVVAQALALGRGMKISCGCFGAAESDQVSGQSLVIAGLAVAMTLVGWLCTGQLRWSAPRLRSS